METPVTLYLGLGTNLGDRRQNLTTAIRLLRERVGHSLRMAPIYRTPAWGVTDQPDFYNTVVELRTHLPSAQVLTEILNIEQEMGRVRLRHWGERLIDIDLLLYGDECIETPTLIVPHPFMAERDFVLVPLADLAPELPHPVHGRTIRELLTDSSDRSVLVRLD